MTNYWVANDGASQPTHVQNFIEDMIVTPDGSAYTWSYWDEGGRSRAIYKDGVWAGINFDTVGLRTHPSRHATRDGITWDIHHFYGMGYVGKTAPPPTGLLPGDTAPLVVSTRGDTIPRAWVVDPTALAFDNQGRLLIGDNGPAQNVKIIDVSVPGRPVAVGTFGDSLGVFGGPVRGVVGPRRFWGIRGLGVDSLGHVYVGCTGMPMQVGGGTHIRAFSSLSDTASVLWEAKCLAFVNSFDADPDSDGTSIHKNSTRFHMDWSKAPKDAWSFAAVTTDPFKYPDDPRLWHSMEAAVFRRIEGKRFLFLGGGMGSGYLAVIRFEENSEIGVPAMFFPLLDYYRDSTQDWCRNRRPIWGNGPDPVGQRHWYWRDDNGDGQVQSNEFHEYNLVFPATSGWDIDAKGDMWWGGLWITQWKLGGLDANGVPRYSFETTKRWNLPFTDNGPYARRIKYFADQDVMVLASGALDNMISKLYRYDNWSDTTRRTLRWSSPVPYRPATTSPFWMDTTIYPTNMTSDTDHVYIGHVQKGPDAQNSGEVSLYNFKTGAREGWIIPGPESDNMAGWIDISPALNVTTRKNGEKILMVEDSYIGKGNVYRWCPRPGGCTTPEVPPHTTSVGDGTVRRAPRLSLSNGKLNVAADPDQAWKLVVYSQMGQVLMPLESKGSLSRALPDRSRVLYVRMQSAGETRNYALVQD